MLIYLTQMHIFYITLTFHLFIFVHSIGLAVAADIPPGVVLKVCSGLMGVGMASIFASAFLWLEQHVLVTNQIGSLMIISAEIGADLFPIVVGQFISSFPMLLMYLQLAVVFICIKLFVLSYYLGRKLGNINKVTN